jgi:hypothetical protein
VTMGLIVRRGSPRGRSCFTFVHGLRLGYHIVCITSISLRAWHPSAQPSRPSTQPPANPAPRPTTTRGPAAIDPASSRLPSHAILACTRRRRPARPWAPSSPAARRGLCACFRFPSILLGLPRRRLPPCLLLRRPPLRRLRLVRLLLLQFNEVLRGALPLGVQDEALVVLGLGEDARPGLEEGGGVGYGAGYGLGWVSIPEKVDGRGRGGYARPCCSWPSAGFRRPLL